MGKTVRCAVTGEVGTDDEFYKRGSKYYKSREAYLQRKKRQKIRKALDAGLEKIYAMICESILDIKTEASRPPLLAKKLRVFKDCDPEIVCLAIELCGDRIAAKIEEPRFGSAYGRYNYIVAALLNELSYAESVQRQRDFQERRESARLASVIKMANDLEGVSTSHMSRWQRED